MPSGIASDQNEVYSQLSLPHDEYPPTRIRASAMRNE